MANTQPYRIKTISQYHEVTGLSKPAHPLVSVINLKDIKPLPANEKLSLVFDFYSISIKRNINDRYKYGQEDYDFDEGVMFCMAPNQVFGIEVGENTARADGWMLLVHPDFLWNTPLAKSIKQYEYFGYAVHEALCLSEKEEATINGIVQNMEQEYHSSIDKFSHNVIVAQLELLLTYTERFYQRQFITRRVASHQILERLEETLTAYFNSEELLSKGLPSVQYVADTLNVSPNYLSALLKALTGQNTQQHIHDKLIEKAKEKLSTSNLSVSQIAYELGFEHPQSFSKLFKSKMEVTPLEFRQSFN